MTEEATPKRVVAYMTPNGKEPFTDWLNDLRDVMGRKRILARISRLQDGNYGDCEPVGEGVSELRMFFGGGYRVYIGERGNDLVIRSVVVIKTVKIEISSKQKPIGRSA